MSRSTEVIVECRDICMGYDTDIDVLVDLDLRVCSGDFFVLSGPNGAGKTSLLRMISLAQPYRSGQLVLFGENTQNLARETRSALRRRIGVVFQEFRLLDHLTAFENVALPLKLAGASDTLIEDHVAEMLKWLGLADDLTKTPQNLSVGQQQLVAVARAVVTRPKLLLADEPTSNLDDRRIKKLMHLFIELQKIGTAIVLATHNTSLAEQYGLERLRMTKGQVSRVGPVG